MQFLNKKLLSTPQKIMLKFEQVQTDKHLTAIWGN